MGFCWILQKLLRRQSYLLLVQKEQTNATFFFNQSNWFQMNLSSKLIIRKTWLVFWSGSPTVHQKQVGWRNWFFCLGLSPLSLFSPWKVANYGQNMLSCNLCYHQNPEWCHGRACGETGAGLRFSLVCKAGQLRVGRLVNPNPREFQQTGLEVQPCIIMLASLTSMWIGLEASPGAGFWKYRWNHNRTTCTGGRIAKLKIIW